MCSSLYNISKNIHPQKYKGFLNTSLIEAGKHKVLLPLIFSAILDQLYHP